MCDGFQISEIGDEKIDAQKLHVREHYAAIDNEGFVVTLKNHAVHSDFAQSSEGNDANRSRRVG